MEKRARRILTLSVALGGAALLAYASTLLPEEQPAAQAAPTTNPRELSERVALSQEDDPTKPRFAVHGPETSTTTDRQFIYFLDGIPDRVRALEMKTKDASNIQRADYQKNVDACAKCHEENYEKWKRHPHRFMNADATPETVKGDFSGNAGIEYMGGTGRFFQQGAEYRIRVAKGELAREFRLTRTIGSRFFQYYVGVQVEGPEPKNDPRYSTEHVMGFGWWIDRKQWVPVEHLPGIGSEYPDGIRENVYEQFPLLSYYQLCHYCHTTLSHGDWLLLAPAIAGRATNTVFGADVPALLKALYPEKAAQATAESPRISSAKYAELWTALENDDWPKNTVALGVTCEACHNGNREHLADPDHVMPSFFPVSPHVATLNKNEKKPYGRTVANINYICGRCHNAPRQTFPDNRSVWNSSEHRDMFVGHCTSQMTCTHCHDPHEPIGAKWKNTDDQDDALCLECHEKLAAPEPRLAHTHHAAGTPGARCMNCHMPKVNEGLQEMVRTHGVLSPADPRTIESNGPNACNMCHVDRSIDWTVAALEKMYGAKYDAAKIAEAYKDRAGPLALSWLEHEDMHMRLVATSSLERQAARAALPRIVSALDDPVMTNRQFAQIAVERMTGVALGELGYRYWMMPDERAPVMKKIRERISEP